MNRHIKLQDNLEIFEPNIPEKLKSNIIYCHNGLKTHQKVLENALEKFNCLQNPDRNKMEQTIRELEGKISEIKADLQLLKTELYRIVDMFNASIADPIPPNRMHFLLLTQLLLYKSVYRAPITPKYTRIIYTEHQLIEKYIDTIKINNDNPQIFDSNEEIIIQHTQHVIDKAADDSSNIVALNLQTNAKLTTVNSQLYSRIIEKGEESSQGERRPKRQRKRKKDSDFIYEENNNSEKETESQLQNVQLVIGNAAGESRNKAASNLQVRVKPPKAKSASRRNTKAIKVTSPIPEENDDKSEEQAQESVLRYFGLYTEEELALKLKQRQQRRKRQRKCNKKYSDYV